MLKDKKFKRERRRGKIRAKIGGSAKKPRVVVFRSNKYIYVQAVDDRGGRTICSASDLGIGEKGKKTDVAGKVGKMLGEKLSKLGIKKVVFDRAGYKYHGRVKAICEAIRNQGIVV